MLEKFIALKDAVQAFVAQIANLFYLIKLRAEYIKDPVTAVDSADVERGVDSAINQYRDVFANPVNLEIARDDGLDIINKSIRDMIGKIGDCEKEVIAAINAVLAINDASVKLLTNDVRTEVINSGIAKADKALPFAEVFERQTAARLQVIMSNHGVNAPTYLAWLYGIAAEMEVGDIVDVIDTSIYDKLEDFIATHKPILVDEAISEFTNTMGTYEPIVDPRYADKLTSYIKVPNSAISGLSIIKGIFQVINTKISGLRDEYTPTGFMIDAELVASKLAAAVEKDLEEDSANALESLTSELEEYVTYKNNILRALIQLVKNESYKHATISTITNAQQLLAEIVIGE